MDITDILVGGAHTLGLNARIRQTIANEQCLPFGLLWRENELTIVLTKDGETVVTILGLLCVSDLGQWKLFLRTISAVIK